MKNRALLHYLQSILILLMIAHLIFMTIWLDIDLFIRISLALIYSFAIILNVFWFLKWPSTERTGGIALKKLGSSLGFIFSTWFWLVLSRNTTYDQVMEITFGIIIVLNFILYIVELAFDDDNKDRLNYFQYALAIIMVLHLFQIGYQLGTLLTFLLVGPAYLPCMIINIYWARKSKNNRDSVNDAKKVVITLIFLFLTWMMTSFLHASTHDFGSTIYLIQIAFAIVGLLSLLLFGLELAAVNKKFIKKQ